VHPSPPPPPGTVAEPAPEPSFLDRARAAQHEGRKQQRERAAAAAAAATGAAPATPATPRRAVSFANQQPQPPAHGNPSPRMARGGDEPGAWGEVARSETRAAASTEQLQASQPQVSRRGPVSARIAQLPGGPRVGTAHTVPGGRLRMKSVMAFAKPALRKKQKIRFSKPMPATVDAMIPGIEKLWQEFLSLDENESGRLDWEQAAVLARLATKQKNWTASSLRAEMGKSICALPQTGEEGDALSFPMFAKCVALSICLPVCLPAYLSIVSQPNEPAAHRHAASLSMLG
jgi:hypothetical protein